MNGEGYIGIIGGNTLPPPGGGGPKNGGKSIGIGGAGRIDCPKVPSHGKGIPGSGQPKGA